jgi:hypothetical protein
VLVLGGWLWCAWWVWMAVERYWCGSWVTLLLLLLWAASFVGEVQQGCGADWQLEGTEGLQAAAGRLWWRRGEQRPRHRLLQQQFFSGKWGL